MKPLYIQRSLNLHLVAVGKEADKKTRKLDDLVVLRENKPPNL